MAVDTHTLLLQIRPRLFSFPQAHYFSGVAYPLAHSVDGGFGHACVCASTLSPPAADRRVRRSLAIGHFAGAYEAAS